MVAIDSPVSAAMARTVTRPVPGAGPETAFCFIASPSGPLGQQLTTFNSYESPKPLDSCSASYLITNNKVSCLFLKHFVSETKHHQLHPGGSTRSRRTVRSKGSPDHHAYTENPHQIVAGRTGRGRRHRARLGRTGPGHRGPGRPGPGPTGRAAW